MVKKFAMHEEEFICDICYMKVTKLYKSVRNHCPFCLTSKHADINPGDRSHACGGIMYPIDIEQGEKDKYKIVFCCEKCHEIKRNVMADDDNYDLILEIVREKAHKSVKGA